MAQARVNDSRGRGWFDTFFTGRSFARGNSRQHCVLIVTQLISRNSFVSFLPSGLFGSRASDTLCETRGAKGEEKERELGQGKKKEGGERAKRGREKKEGGEKRAAGERIHVVAVQFSLTLAVSLVVFC